MKISIIMPVYNEERTIGAAVQRVLDSPFPQDKEIIVVNDGSTDATAERLAGFSATPVRVISLPANRGKGAALREGFRQATGEIIIVQDTDLEYSTTDYPALITPIIEGKADVVYGSRFTGGEHRVHLYWHSVGNRFLTTLSNMTTNLNLTDMEVGAKVFRSAVLARITLEQNRFGFEPEITAKLARLPDCRIYEVPIDYHGRTYAEGKKINWRDGITAVWCILRYGLFD